MHFEYGIYSPPSKAGILDLPSGVNRIPQYYTINGTTKLPAMKYNGKDANLSDFPPWNFGETVDVSGGDGALVCNHGSPCLGFHDDSVKFSTDEGGPSYIADNNTFGNVGTDDIVIQGLLRFNSYSGWTGISTVLKKISTDGYQLSFSHSDLKLSFFINDSTGLIETESDALSFDVWYWIEVFADRSGDCQIYVNGTASGAAVDISAYSATLDAATPVHMGDGNFNLAFLSLYHGAAWLDSATQTQLALDNFSRLTGVYPSIFGASTEGATGLAPAIDRSSNAYIEKYDLAIDSLKLHRVGSDWMRVCSRRNDVSGGVVRGYLAENSAINLICESEDFATTWTLLGT